MFNKDFNEDKDDNLKYAGLWQYLTGGRTRSKEAVIGKKNNKKIK
jgi:hypothetical protein